MVQHGAFSSRVSAGGARKEQRGEHSHSTNDGYDADERHVSCGLWDGPRREAMVESPGNHRQGKRCDNEHPTEERDPLAKRHPWCARHERGARHDSQGEFGEVRPLRRREAAKKSLRGLGVDDRPTAESEQVQREQHDPGDANPGTHAIHSLTQPPVLCWRTPGYQCRENRYTLTRCTPKSSECTPSMRSPEI